MEKLRFFERDENGQMYRKQEPPREMYPQESVLFQKEKLIQHIEKLRLRLKAAKEEDITLGSAEDSRDKINKTKEGDRDKKILALENEIKEREAYLDKLDELYKEHSKVEVMNVSRGSKPTSVIRLPEKGVRVRFVFKDEKRGGQPVPVADSHVLYWRYDKNDKKIDPMPFQHRYHARCGWGKTDSKGYVYTDESGLTDGSVNISKKTGRFTMSYDWLNFDEVKETLEYIPIEEIESERTHKIIAAFSKKHFESLPSVADHTDDSVDMDDITTQSKYEFFLPKKTYGFIVLPMDMGVCSIKDLIKLGGKTFSINGKEKVVATKVKPPIDESPIELHCTLREWDRRIQKKVRKLQIMNKRKMQYNASHTRNILWLDQMYHQISIMTKYPYYSKSFIERKLTDLKRFIPFSGETINDIIEREHEIEDLNRKREVYHSIEERRREYTQQIDTLQQERDDLLEKFSREIEEIHTSDQNIDENKLRLLSGIDELKRHIADYIENRPLYTNGNNLFEKSEDDFFKQAESFNEAFDKEANELWSMLKSDAFRDEFIEFLDRQKDNPQPNESTPVVFPVASPYMENEYHLEHIYDTLNHALIILKSTVVKEELWKTECWPGLNTLSNQKEFKEFHQIMVEELQARISELRKPDDTIPAEERKRRNEQARRLDLIVLSYDTKNSKNKQENESLLSAVWQRFKISEEFLRTTVVSVPGPPCLLQSSLNVFEDFVCHQIMKSPKNRERYVKLLTTLVQLARFSPGNRRVIARSITGSLDKSVRMLRTNRLLKDHFLGEAVYNEGKKSLASSRIQLSRVVALKTALMVLSYESLDDKWIELEGIIKNGKQNDFTDWVSDVAKVMQAAGDTASIAANSYLLANNMYNLFTSKSLAAAKTITKVAGGIGFTMSAIATVQTSVEAIEMVYRQGMTSKNLKLVITAISSGLTTAALIMSSETILGLANCLYIPGLGPYLFGAGVAIAILSAGMFYIYEDIIKEQSLKSFDEKWEMILNSQEVSHYSPEIIDRMEKYRSDVDFGEKLSWHAIVPLTHLGYNPGTIDDWLAHVDLKEELGYNDDKQISFSAMPMHDSHFVTAFYNDVSREELAEEKIGSKTCRTITNELTAGTYVPEGIREDELYASGNQSGFKEAVKANFIRKLDHPFYRVKADFRGIHELCRYAVLIDAHIKEYPNSSLSLEMLEPNRNVEQVYEN